MECQQSWSVGCHQLPISPHALSFSGSSNPFSLGWCILAEGVSRSDLKTLCSELKPDHSRVHLSGLSAIHVVSRRKTASVKLFSGRFRRVLYTSRLRQQMSPRITLNVLRDNQRCCEELTRSRNRDRYSLSLASGSEGISKVIHCLNHGVIDHYHQIASLQFGSFCG